MVRALVAGVIVVAFSHNTGFAEDGRLSLETLEPKLVQADRDLRDATSRLRELEGRIREYERTSADRRARMEERTGRIADRLKVMYRLRRRGLLPYLFSASSVHDLLESTRYLLHILRKDEAELRLWAEEKEALDRATDRAEADREEMLRLAGEAAARRADLEALRSEHQLIVQRLPVAERGTLHEERLERGESALREATTAEKGPTPAAAPTAAPTDAAKDPQGGLSGRKRSLPMPARGDIVQAGRGVAILAEAGAPIRAVSAGKVQRVLWIAGYGLVAIVDHGGGWVSVYGHAAGFEVVEGQGISAGQRIGAVGDSGSVEGARLHFEVRKDRAALPPLEWLDVPADVTVHDP